MSSSSGACFLLAALAPLDLDHMKTVGCRRLILIGLILFPRPVAIAQGPVSLFDGQSCAGWEGDTGQTWRIEAGSFTAGSPEKAAPRNEFLATTREFTNFDLRLKFKIQGTEALNAGVQFRTKRFP